MHAAAAIGRFFRYCFRFLLHLDYRETKTVQGTVAQAFCLR